MRPFLVTAPTEPVCDLAWMRARMRVDGTEEDAELQALEAAAVGYLDGWHGILGRAIKQQTWAQKFNDWGDLPLAMPDVVSFAVTGTDADGQDVTPEVSELVNDVRGPIIKAAGGPVDFVVVEYTVSLPIQLLKTAEVLVWLLVRNWSPLSGSLDGTAVAQHSKSVTSLIDQLRWMGQPCISGT